MESLAAMCLPVILGFRVAVRDGTVESCFCNVDFVPHWPHLFPTKTLYHDIAAASYAAYRTIFALRETKLSLEVCILVFRSFFPPGVDWRFLSDKLAF